MCMTCCNQACTHNCVSSAWSFLVGCVQVIAVCICWIYNTVLSSAVDCGDPGTPSNGRRTGSSTTLNSVVTYTCNTGYTRQGSSRRTCQSNGQWSGSVPQCNRELIKLNYNEWYITIYKGNSTNQKIVSHGSCCLYRCFNSTLGPHQAHTDKDARLGQSVCMDNKIHLNDFLTSGVSHINHNANSSHAELFDVLHCHMVAVGNSV